MNSTKFNITAITYMYIPESRINGSQITYTDICGIVYQKVSHSHAVVVTCPAQPFFIVFFSHSASAVTAPVLFPPVFTLSVNLSTGNCNMTGIVNIKHSWVPFHLNSSDPGINTANNRLICCT